MAQISIHLMFTLKLEELHDDQHIILGGDFNLIMNMNLDSKNYKNLNNKKARQEVIKLIELFNLKDMFRQANPEKNRIHMEKKKSDKTSNVRYLFDIRHTINNEPNNNS